MEGNLQIKIEWASLLLGSKFTVFACLRWLNTVLRAVSGNWHDGVCFK